MKLTEKSVLGSILLALAAVVVLWYMTIALERIPTDTNADNNQGSSQEDNPRKENASPQNNLDALERVQEYPVGNTAPTGSPGETQDPETIVPTF